MGCSDLIIILREYRGKINVVIYNILLSRHFIGFNEGMNEIEEVLGH
jgi:hypothetical protein